MSANSYESLFLFISLLIQVLAERVSNSGFWVSPHPYYSSIQFYLYPGALQEPRAWPLSK